MDSSAFAVATALCERQYGYITAAQARGAGLSKAVVDRLVRDGHWQRLGGGLYRMNGVRPAWRGRMMAACLRAGADAVVSHRSAAAVWGIDGFGPPAMIDVSVSAGRRPRISGVRVHRRTLDRRNFRDGIPVTPVPETILDLCGLGGNPAIPLRALDDVRRRKLVSSFEFERCAAEHHGPGQSGSVLFRQLLERRLGRTPPGTVFSAEVLDLLVDAGLPEPEAEAWVTIGGRRYRIDLAYRRPKIAIECLGKIGHLNERAFEEDPIRNNDFAIAGWLQLWVTYRRKEERPERVIADVSDALACRGGV